MKGFIDDNFLLNNETAAVLYHRYAKKMPIFDYHCHLNPKEIWEDKKFANITDLWLSKDHYKWRAMRANGIPEEYITGEADDYEKFKAWAKTVPHLIGNPLYHWTHLELKRYFGIDALLNEETADSIWDTCNALLSEDEFSARSLIERSNVVFIGTTDDPTDSLIYHRKIKEEGRFKVAVRPTFRIDRGMEIDRPEFREWIRLLEESSGRQIETYDDFLEALEDRIGFFHQEGCRISDVSLGVLVYAEAPKKEVESVFQKALEGEPVNPEEQAKYRTWTLVHLGKLYARLGWTMQIHIGALRNNNTRLFSVTGRDAGFDSMNDRAVAEPLARFLDALDKENALPKTILYNLNPKDNLTIATMIGNFQGEGIPGKLQFGAAWWFNDHKHGIIRQLTDLANTGLLGRFVGMLTDSRSFLSYVRHEYFRRILCDLVGEWAEKGEVPNDIEFLGELVQNISYRNAAQYFGMAV